MIGGPLPEPPEKPEWAAFNQVAQGYDATLRAAEAALQAQPGADDYFDAANQVAELRRRLADEEGVRAFRVVLAESLQTLAHTFFALLDGATADDPRERIFATDREGRRLEQGLHERWADFLLATGCID